MSNINIGTEINLEDLLVSRLLIQANSGGGKSGLARKIMEQIYGKVPFIVIDYDGEYYTLKEKLSDVIVIGGHAADIPIGLQSAKLLPREIISNRLSVVIDPSEMKMPDRVRYMKVFLESLMELPKTLWTPYFIFIEEAHKYCGEQDKQDSGPAVRDLMSRGRKMGYCGILMTQRIAKLHKDAAAECNNKFVGRTNLDIDMDRAARELGFTASSEYTRLSLRDLKPRHFYCYGTSINPHHVHEITVGLCDTTIPKQGQIIDIKPKKPTEKMLAALSKLNGLPGTALQEAKDLAGLQKEVTRLKGELAKAGKIAVPVKSVDVDNAVTIAKDEMRRNYTAAIKERDNIVVTTQNQVRKLQAVLVKIAQLSGGQSEPIQAIPAVRPITNGKATTDSIKPAMAKPTVRQTEGGLGRCALNIIRFLAGFPEKTFTKAQIATVTGYSVGSGGFNNALSDLNTRGLILRGERLTFNPDAMSEIIWLAGPIDTNQSYDISTFKASLGKCEREIYEVLLESPEESFDKETLAGACPSKYSPGSGGFNNALSRLNTLELIERVNGEIRLNPELLELL